MIPKLSAPLVKLIRTGEGIVLYGFNIVGMLLPILTSLPWGTSIKWLAVTNAVSFASRQVLKAVAATQPMVGAPIPFTPAGVTSEQILAEIGAVEQATGLAQAQAGTPADKVTASMAADPPPTPPHPFNQAPETVAPPAA